ncbi:ECF RNA polymerase sigma factor SigF [Burkholderiales bacterium]|nr:ECF RNA polymerase sigma factor SigF [Burkholderiales bacterium]
MGSSIEERLRGPWLAALAGDSAAYADCLRELAAMLRGYYRKRLVSLPDEVEDLVQETLIAMHNRRHTYDPGRPLTAWAHAIAKYKYVDLMRRRAVRDELHEPIDDDLEAFAASDHDAADARRDLRKLLATLPERHRRPIECVKIEGLSVAETARRTGMSESAVKVGVHRGLKALAELIRRQP